MLNIHGKSTPTHYLCMWLELASINGDPNAQATKASVAQRMTPDEIEKTKGLAQECIEKDYKNC